MANKLELSSFVRQEVLAENAPAATASLPPTTGTQDTNKPGQVSTQQGPIFATDGSISFTAMTANSALWSVLNTISHKKCDTYSRSSVEGVFNWLKAKHPQLIKQLDNGGYAVSFTKDQVNQLANSMQTSINSAVSGK